MSFPHYELLNSGLIRQHNITPLGSNPEVYISWRRPGTWLLWPMPVAVFLQVYEILDRNLVSKYFLTALHYSALTAIQLIRAAFFAHFLTSGSPFKHRPVNKRACMCSNDFVLAL